MVGSGSQSNRWSCLTGHPATMADSVNGSFAPVAVGESHSYMLLESIFSAVIAIILPIPASRRINPTVLCGRPVKSERGLGQATTSWNPFRSSLKTCTGKPLTGCAERQTMRGVFHGQLWRSVWGKNPMKFCRILLITIGLDEKSSEK